MIPERPGTLLPNIGDASTAAKVYKQNLRFNTEVLARVRAGAAEISRPYN